MKRIIFSFLLAISSLASYAYTAYIDGIYYNLNSEAKTADVTYKDKRYNSYSGIVTIPETVTFEGNEYYVTSIGNSAFSKCANLSSVTIPNSVTNIGDNAFNGCSILTSVTISSSLTSIGESAFDGCSSLPVIDNIRYADTYLVEVIDHKCTSVNIKEGTLYIGSHAFETCLWLTSVTIPNSVMIIGDNAFNFCSSLPSVTIPNSVTRIGNGAFQYCSSLTTVDISNSVASIGNYAFQYCPSLTTATIPNSVTSLGDFSFSGCSRLTSITLSNSISSIGEGTFYGCGLLSVTIPHSVKNIGSYAFYTCFNIQDIHSNNPTPPTIDDNNIFSGINTAQCILYVPKGAKEDYASANGWRDFYNIVEEEVNSIAPAAMPNTNSNGASIYTLLGEKVMNTNNLPAGIYIKNGKKVLVK